MASIKSTIITAVLTFTAITSAHPPATPSVQVMTKDAGGAVGASYYGIRDPVNRDASPPFTMAKIMAQGQQHMESLSIITGKPLEEDIEDGAPAPRSDEDFYCHTTQSSANITDANAAVSYFSSLDKQSCQNKPRKCLNMLSLPGGDNVDIRVWTCGHAEDSAECSTVAPILTQLISSCSKDFTETDSSGNQTTFTRVGGVAWLSSARIAWISLEGKHRD